MANPTPSSPLNRYLLYLLLLVTGALQAQEAPFLESVVIFNTICARCHEAECSGRLSFEAAYEAAIQHIVRHYAGAANKAWLQRQLFQLLGYMKEMCAYYPVMIPIPPQRIWSSELLDKFATLLQRDYFVPLGPLPPGDYSIELLLEEESSANIQIISESFDMMVDEFYEAADKRIAIPLHIAEPDNYYFGIYPQRPTLLLRLGVLEEKSE